MLQPVKVTILLQFLEEDRVVEQVAMTRIADDLRPESTTCIVADLGLTAMMTAFDRVVNDARRWESDHAYEQFPK